jgi:type-F conjugative transfer system pilin assembly protein TrbC
MDGMENKRLLYWLSISIIATVFFLLPCYVTPIHAAGRSAGPDMSVLVPCQSEIQKTAKKYEHLLNGQADMEAISRIANPDKETQTQMLPAVKSLQDSIQERESQKRKPYIFYLFSGSVPDVAVDSVFAQSRRLPCPFFGVIRGVDKDRNIIKKIQDLYQKERDVTVKINPRIYRQLNAEMVPAFVFAYCPTPSRFRSKECEYKYILYGDMSLMGALEIMARENTQDKDINQIYEAIRNAF